MITNILIARTEGDISIRTATEADKENYVTFVLEEGLSPQGLLKKELEMGIDPRDTIWAERYNMDCIMFAIVENLGGKTVGFCEIENIDSAEPTIGIELAKSYRGKGYGYLAAKMMIEEGWKIFDHPHFIWEVEQDNIASIKLALKLNGIFTGRRGILSENTIKILQECGIEVTEENNPNTIERYKIERP